MKIRRSLFVSIASVNSAEDLTHIIQLPRLLHLLKRSKKPKFDERTTQIGVVEVVLSSSEVDQIPMCAWEHDELYKDCISFSSL
jgi:hypothetical protein